MCYLNRYHNKYIFTSCHVLEKNYPCAQLHATRAFGICAMYGGNQFKFYASAGISYLSKVISKGLSTSELYDTAVAALGKICEFHRDNTGSMVVKKWLYFLPLKHDLYMHMGCFLN
ncbi:hypothetical protein MtrunA17_Chr3g0110071 [Medicago truncatula]|uniref:Uncharacterized protein n=1 Tax=Medicago truncatula TaxID=3880 RepID=A0A396IYQ2_MEDTR|nr:hypothetical protein MtrunA17_Chr3g0110071 [Medicago truncatula]